MSADPVDGLAQALDATDRLIAGIGDGQWQYPTPCTQWNVHDLVDHLVSVNRRFSAMLRGEQPPGGGAQDASRGDGDLVAAYRDSGDRMLTAFRRPGVFEQTFTLPIGAAPAIAALHLRITDLLVHGWDIAQATGQPAHLPERLAALELEFTRAKLADVPADRRPFAPPQPVADDAPAIDRLAAYLGRPVPTAGATHARP
ncbi:MAG: hypothetical protein JWP76_5882 [Dactylosporangium sp.]|nr:hypothetical protein [Dactylosporangium sp.]